MAEHSQESIPQVVPSAKVSPTPGSSVTAIQQQTAQRSQSAELASVQFRGQETSSQGQSDELSAAGIRGIADKGVSGSGGALPFANQIQASFGHHDISGLKGHVGGQAAAASQQIGAEAYTTGDQIAFAGQPSLHTAAHEATHGVLQQRGIQPAGGVGHAGDAYEIHADQVADAVVSGKSAEALLDSPPEGATSAHPAAASGPIQRKDPPPTATPATPATDTDQNLDEDGNPREPTEEEIAQMVADAKAQGSAQASSTPEIVANGPAVAEEPVVVAPEAQAQENPLVTDGGGERPVFAAIPAAPGAGLTGFQGLKSGALSNWDDEIAWHDYFQGAGPTADVAIDRDALIADALGGGALAGFQDGLKNIAIDTAINVASSRIPYLQGFVEIAKIAYDPAAWLEGTVQGTYGNVAQGGSMLLEGIQGGDPIGALDGLLTVSEGLNNVISTLSTICWIVAAASFLLSFICPAAIPFVALAANWGLTLGTVSTAIGIYITLGRALVIALRALQIKYGEADPQALLAQGERLRTQTQKFTGEFTTRAGNRMRGAAQERLQRNNAPATPTQAQPRTSTGTAQPRTRMQRIMGALNTTATVVSGGGNPSSASRDARNAVSTARQGTQAFRGTGQYAEAPGGGQRSQRQQVADMEHAGLTVFHSDAARGRFNQRTKGQTEGVNRHLHAAQQAANQRLQDADSADARARERLQQAQDEADSARRQLALLDGDKNLHERIASTRAKHEADLRTVQESQRAIETQRHVIRTLEQEMANRRAAGASDQVISIYQEHISRANIELLNRQNTLSHAKVDVATSNLARVRAQMTLDGARNLHNEAQNNLNVAQTEANATGQNKMAAQTGVTNANDAVANNTDHGFSARTAQSNRERADTQNKQWMFDFTGQGPTDLHGHNKGAGVTGAGGDLILHLGEQAIAEGTGTQDASTNFMGVWDKTTGDQPLDMTGSAGDRGEGKNYQDQLQVRFDTLKGTLRAPPAGVPNTIDGAVVAHAALDEENRKIEFQKEVMISLLAEGQVEMSGLDAMQAISQANQAALTQHQTQLGERRVAQDELAATGGETQTQAAEGESNSSSTAETIGGFMGRFMEMLNIVPSRVIPSGGDGITQVSSVANNQQAVSGDANATAANAVNAAGTFTTQTETAQTEAAADAATLTAFDAQVEQERLSAMDGQTFLTESLTSAGERQLLLQQEMDRLVAEHQAAVQSGGSWADTHQRERIAGLGELDGIVTLIDNGSGG